jgi:hypothetical protein
MSRKGKEKVNYKLLDVEDKIKEHKDYATLIKQSNTIISKIDNDKKLSDSELRLVKRVGLGLDNEKSEIHAKSILESFRDDEQSALENKKLLASAYKERNGILNEENKSKIVDSNKSNFVQDSSNITGETEPFDFMDLDG